MAGITAALPPDLKVQNCPDMITYQVFAVNISHVRSLSISAIHSSRHNHLKISRVPERTTFKEAMLIVLGCNHVLLAQLKPANISRGMKMNVSDVSQGTSESNFWDTDFSRIPLMVAAVEFAKTKRF